MSEKLWERIGFSIAGITAGFIYSLAFCLLLLPFSNQINFGLIIQVFVVVFGLSGLFGGSIIFNSVIGSIYALYILYGFIVGFLSTSGASWEPNAEFFKNKGSALPLFILGLVSGVICIFTIYL